MGVSANRETPKKVTLERTLKDPFKEPLKDPYLTVPLVSETPKCLYLTPKASRWDTGDMQVAGAVCLCF